jgi:predicted amidohydrolase YtcJ
LVFRNARVFDGTRVISRADVLVRDGRIAAVGTDIAIPEGAQVIDGSGKTLLPGLIDAHAHVWMRTALKQQHLVFGVTTVLDMFTDAQFAAGMRKEQSAGQASDRADLYSAGVLVTAPGGHGTEYPNKVPTLSNPSQAQAFGMHASRRARITSS